MTEKCTHKQLWNKSPLVIQVIFLKREQNKTKPEPPSVYECTLVILQINSMPLLVGNHYKKVPTKMSINRYTLKHAITTSSLAPTNVWPNLSDVSWKVTWRTTARGGRYRVDTVTYRSNSTRCSLISKIAQNFWSNASTSAARRLFPVLMWVF
jgi:hypothetical protein